MAMPFHFLLQYGIPFQPGILLLLLLLFHFFPWPGPSPPGWPFPTDDLLFLDFLLSAGPFQLGFLLIKTVFFGVFPEFPATLPFYSLPCIIYLILIHTSGKKFSSWVFTVRLYRAAAGCLKSESCAFPAYSYEAVLDVFIDDLYDQKDNEDEDQNDGCLVLFQILPDRDLLRFRLLFLLF